MFAHQLDLPNPEPYTKHWVRQQALINMADAGCDVRQMMATGGNKTDHNTVALVLSTTQTITCHKYAPSQGSISWWPSA